MAGQTGRRTARRQVTRLAAGMPPRIREDHLAVEEPLEIRVDGAPLVVTMRTPGHDVELAAGYLVSEGVLRQRSDLVTARYCAGSDRGGPADPETFAGNSYNVLDLRLAPGIEIAEPTTDRHGYVSSACGVCGKTSIDALRTRIPAGLDRDPTRVRSALLSELPDRLRAEQQVFGRTGGLHAAGLFDAETGRSLVVREDVGRHNAVDKVVGWALEHERLPLQGMVLMVSGRTSFELTQKAAMAGIPVLAAVSAPSSLAAELAEESGICLVGFLRGESMVVYTRPDRAVTEEEP